ncbi:MAG: addiction module protein [Rhodocyclaceae bacterium]|jgi:putative addiction module component (TIGR02574 family)|nr:addiction module protein [Rhodocyclaceae bacterium]MBK6554295.1 addiction module protein [Rhodocyclaceae bacterium]MBK6677750.1 addiction module protein [Rhodocyclaceae bacterium]MBK7813101.1 addiction module protein [Rhodocyclaceae bacterium]MBK9310422.1 addiction module protein [Rhodocyclaceae bacterium]
MNTQVKELFEQARKLSEDERIELADLLYAETAIPYAEWEAAWVAEAESRLEAYRRGEMQAVDAEEVHARLREKYGFK